MKSHLERAICFAPMEGVTTAVYRRVHKRHFRGIARYYSPFIVASDTRSFRRREKREFYPFEPGLVPQILTASARDFIWAAKRLADTGYGEVNLNLGCPSATVVTKGKGSGMLKDPRLLKLFFDEVFVEPDMPGISIKTRIGFEERSEAEELADVFSLYPFSEVIIHPRTRQDLYDGKPDMDAFLLMAEKIRNGSGRESRIVYNGDVWDISDYDRICSMLPPDMGIMIGRGLIADPCMADEILFSAFTETPERIEGIRMFLRDLREEYRHELSGDRDVLFKLKEIWSYMGRKLASQGTEDALKAIRRTGSLSEYILAERQILDGASGMLWFIPCFI